jgi:hypothetical protein
LKIIASTWFARRLARSDDIARRHFERRYNAVRFRQVKWQRGRIGRGSRGSVDSTMRRGVGVEEFASPKKLERRRGATSRPES